MMKAGFFTSSESVEDALARGDRAVFIVDRDVFQGITVETIKGLMTILEIVD